MPNKAFAVINLDLAKFNLHFDIPFEKFNNFAFGGGAEVRAGVGVEAGMGIGTGVEAGMGIGIGAEAGMGLGIGAEAGIGIGIGAETGTETETETGATELFTILIYLSILSIIGINYMSLKKSFLLSSI